MIYLATPCWILEFAGVSGKIQRTWELRLASCGSLFVLGLNAREFPSFAPLGLFDLVFVFPMACAMGCMLSPLCGCIPVTEWGEHYGVRAAACQHQIVKELTLSRR